MVETYSRDIGRSGLDTYLADTNLGRIYCYAIPLAQSLDRGFPEHDHSDELSLRLLCLLVPVASIASGNELTPI